MLGNCVIFVNTILGLIWIILGFIARWGWAPGRICAGDYTEESNSKHLPYAWKSAFFMKVYLIIAVGLILIILCVAGLRFALCAINE